MTTHRFSVCLSTVFSGALAAGIALTPPGPAFALSGPEATCRDTIAKSEAKYAKLAVQAILRCHRDRSSGDRALTSDCNVVSQADHTGKVIRARGKLVAKVVSACGGASSLLSQYPACPDPVGYVDNGGATTEIDDFHEVAHCLFALIDDRAGDTTFDAMGLPEERVLRAVGDCQQGLGRGVGNLIRAYLGTRRKCQRAADSSGGGLAYSCEGTDQDGKITAAQATLADLVFDNCAYIPSSELAKLHACSDDAAILADCAQAAADLHGAEIIQNAYELPEPPPTTTTTTTTLAPSCGSTFPTCNGECAAGTFCENTGSECQCVTGTGACEPATILRHLNARYGTPAAETQLSTGWTGKTHVVDVPDDSFDALDVTCDSNCENCEVSLNPRIGDPTTNCRCASNPRTSCTSVAGVDTQNCGGINPICNCYFGPALAISSGGTPVCVLNQLREDYSGSMDLRTGNYSDVIKLGSLVHLGISQFAPCPTCDGDTAPGDGARDGNCNGGLQNGQTCDAHGTHRTFGPVSFDCPPASSTNISGSGLQITLNLSVDEQSLSSALPCDVGGSCPCRVCSDNSQLGCTSDADCAAESAGTCTAGGDVPIEANDCTDGICTAQGQCATGPIDRFCDGAVHADGRGFVSCTTNADCAPLGAGACTILDLRRCFPNPITVSGEADIDNPSTAAIFCIPATTNIAVNQTAGLPGPGTVNLNFDADVRCQSDIDQPYDFPSGENCPTLVTTTTTTTTTLPLPACGSATFPVCGGVCPGLLVCTPTLVNTCVCQGA